MFAAVVLSIAVQPVATMPTAPTRLLVRVEPQTALRAPLLTAVTTEARRIWRPYLDVVFAASDDPVGSDFDDEISLQILDRALSRSARDRASLGEIRFVGAGAPVRRIAVSAAGARELAAETIWAGRPIAVMPRSISNAFLTHALARATAHEIGHYLLRSSAHTSRGLMRAAFPTDELMADGLEKYQLEPAQSARLLRQRLARAPAAPGVEGALQEDRSVLE
jgi:hypothetical protein